MTSQIRYVPCPQCQAQTAVTEADSRSVVTCDNCLEEFEVPELPAAPARDSSPSPRPAPGSSEEDAFFDDSFDLSDVAPDSAASNVLELPSVPQAPSAPHAAAPSTASSSPPPPDSESDSLKIDDLMLDDYPTVPASDLSDNYEFTVVCSICGTRLSADDSQIGTRVPCPDCFSQVEVREPAKHQRHQRRGSGRSDVTDEYQLSDPPTSPPPSSMPMVGPLETPTERSRISPEQDALRKAEEELRESDPPEDPIVGNPLTQGLLGFWSDPGTILRMCLLAIGCAVESVAIRASLERLSAEDPVTQFVSMALMAFSFVFGVMLFAAVGASLVVVVQETSGGSNQIDNWPGANFLEWGLDGLFVAASLFVGIVLGFFVGQISFVFGSLYIYGLVIVMTAAVGATFPVLFLSSLETGSPIGFHSPPIWQSLGYARDYWIQFWVMSALLLLPAVGFVLIPAGPIVSLILSLFSVALLMTYFRTLGRLAWVCQGLAPEPEEEEEDAS